MILAEQVLLTDEFVLDPDLLDNYKSNFVSFMAVTIDTFHLYCIPLLTSFLYA